MSMKYPEAHGFVQTAAYEGLYTLLSISFDPDRDGCILTCDDLSTGFLKLFVLPATKDLRTLWVTAFGYCPNLSLHVENQQQHTTFRVTRGKSAGTAASIALEAETVKKGTYEIDGNETMPIDPGHPHRVIGVVTRHKLERPPGLVLMSDTKRPMLTYVQSTLSQTQEWTDTITAPPSHVLRFRRDGRSYLPFLVKS